MRDEAILQKQKNEANPETAKYSSDAKELEAIENKLSKAGFNVVIRVVVSSSSKEASQAHLDNILAAMAQFNGVNSFIRNKHKFKALFMQDFIYRYLPMRGQTSILSSEELATVFISQIKAYPHPIFFGLMPSVHQHQQASPMKEHI